MIDLVANIIGLRGLLIICAVLLLGCGGLGIAVEIQGSRLDAAQAKTQVQAVQLQSLDNQVTAQNAAVDQMLANAAKQADRLKAAEQKAARTRVVTRDRIRYVDRAVIPATCPEAITWGAGHAIEIGRRWEGL